MQERSAMASLGKADAGASCLSSQCFDPLTRSCVMCSELFGDNTKPAPAVPSSDTLPTIPSTDLPSSLLIFGVPALVVLLLALAGLWGFLACKMEKRRRKRRKTEKEVEESLGDAGPLPSLGCLDLTTPERNADPAQGPCPHRNGGLRTPRRDGAMRRPCCQGDAKGDVVLLATAWPRHKEHGHGFPLPATELGATALVTTKTTQDCVGEERL
ncbi:tumor necrosis factor receptor superfamily member 13C isoform X2 [Numida meleagris]|uniref:tumor necrosis factor receptor superfamily member 13C isoform X2 n=1 Tax=Numida meleagris TaxID=8996 RepID=UPI000B3E21C7|nr:tumor necrosis factor receptor superfamily member 13C isoform X2 [Numida meleagris]